MIWGLAFLCKSGQDNSYHNNNDDYDCYHIDVEEEEEDREDETPIGFSVIISLQRDRPLTYFRASNKQRLFEENKNCLACRFAPSYVVEFYCLFVFAATVRAL